jgi:2-hydroxychromene-2-carboxylate isomerase
LSRLAWATAPAGQTPGRWACEQVLHHVWIGGADAEAPERLAALRAELAPAIDPASDEAKQRLRAATDDALANGVFGVPTLGIDDKRFWGFDALDMAADYVRGAPWFSEPHWEREGAPRPGVKR